MAGMEGLNPVFASRLSSMIAASGGLLAPGSGRRSIEEQIALRKSNGCPDIWTSPASTCRIPTAIPGRSNHNHGLAMDLVDTATGRAVQAGSKADAWLRANARQFGLHQAVAGEAWHIEMIDGEEARGAVPPGAIGFDVNWMEEQGNPEDELVSRIDSIMSIVTGGTPDIEEPADAMGPIGMDTATMPGGQPTGAMPSGGGAVEGDQLTNARIIAEIGREMGAPPEAIKIALAAGLVESGLRNVNYGDRDSLGLFQQRPSQGWGSPEQVMDPRYASRQFFSRLLASDWQSMDPGAAAQAVQRSAYPDRYGERYGEAVNIFNQLGGF